MCYMYVTGWLQKGVHIVSYRMVHYTHVILDGTEVKMCPTCEYVCVLKAKLSHVWLDDGCIQLRHLWVNKA